MDKHNHHHDGGGFANGFLLGIIVGAALVFFLFTKKGKQMFKVLSEEGLEGLSEFKGLLDLDLEDEEEEVGKDYADNRVESTGSSVAKVTKRFFRGIRK